MRDEWLRNYRDALRNLRCFDWEQIGSPLLNRTFDNLQQIKRSHYQSINGQLSPLLKITDKDNNLIGGPPTKIVKELFQNDDLYPIIEEVITRSIWTKGDRRYRTDFEDGTAYISGDDVDSVYALGSIIHELGHALFHSVFREFNSINDVASELMAMSLEYMVMVNWLDFQNWKDRLLLTDYLNTHFFHFEFKILMGGNINPYPFTNRFLVFRQSLFCTPGYQLIYVLCSVLRTNIIHNVHDLKSMLTNCLKLSQQALPGFSV